SRFDRSLIPEGLGFDEAQDADPIMQDFLRELRLRMEHLYPGTASLMAAGDPRQGIRGSFWGVPSAVSFKRLLASLGLSRPDQWLYLRQNVRAQHAGTLGYPNAASMDPAIVGGGLGNPPEGIGSPPVEWWTGRDPYKSAAPMLPAGLRHGPAGAPVLFEGAN